MRCGAEARAEGRCAYADGVIKREYAPIPELEEHDVRNQLGDGTNAQNCVRVHVPIHLIGELCE